MLAPPTLAPGDTIRVIAPAGPCDPTLLWRGLSWLRSRYRVKWTRGIFARQHYTAGDDARRCLELQEAVRETDTKAIVAVRGGYGCTRIVDDIDWSPMVQRPKWLIGFSDLTALHLRLQRLEVCSLHAAHAAQLGRADESARRLWLQALEAPTRPRQWVSLETVQPGSAHGTLRGGNLALIHDQAAAGTLRLPRNTVLFLEEVHESPYRIDRMLTALVRGGHFQNVCAIALGQFEGCRPESLTRSTLAQCLRSVDIPVVAGLPMGHGEPNEPLHFGYDAFVDAKLGPGGSRLALHPPRRTP